MRAIDGDELYLSFGIAADRTQITTIDITELHEHIYGEFAPVLTREDFVGHAHWQAKHVNGKVTYYCAHCNNCEDMTSPYCRQCGFKMDQPMQQDENINE